MLLRKDLSGRIYETASSMSALATQKMWVFLFFLTLALAPAVLDLLTLSSMIPLFFFMMFAISWDIVSGYTGQLSFGHSIFFAIGGYTTAVLNVQHGLHPLASIFTAVVISAFAGMLVGFPALRVKGYYLAVMTLVLQFFLLQLVIFFDSELMVDVMGISIPIAPEGLGGIDGFPVGPDSLVGTLDSSLIVAPNFRMKILYEYYIILGLLILIYSTAYLITRSHIGDVLTAIRQNEKTTAASGFNTTKYKLFSFTVSALIGGLAGAVFVHSVGFPQPAQILNFELSVNVIVFSILGGLGTITGAMIGVVIFAVIESLTEQLSSNFGLFIPGTEISLKDLNTALVLGIAILLLHVAPGGVIRWLTAIREKYMEDYGNRFSPNLSERGSIDEE